MNKNKKLIMAQKGLSSSVVELNTEQVDCLIKIVEDVIKREEDKYYLLLDDNEKEFSKGAERSFENLHDTVDSIRIALSQVVRKEPYCLSENAIKDLAIVIDKYSIKGKEYWANELLKWPKPGYSRKGCYII